MKKPKKILKKRYTGPTLADKLPKTEKEWLQLCVKFTERAIHNPPWEEDKFLFSQIERLKERIKREPK